MNTNRDNNDDDNNNNNYNNNFLNILKLTSLQIL